MAKYSRKWDLIALVFIAIIFIGFRLVTQAGQEGLIFQNDGYVMTGGAMILAGGMALGWWYTKQKNYKRTK